MPSIFTAESSRPSLYLRLAGLSLSLGGLAVLVVKGFSLCKIVCVTTHVPQHHLVLGSRVTVSCKIQIDTELAET